MAASGVADIAVGFEWTPFSHGFAFWEYPGPEHLPPADEAGQREWLEGFLQAHADHLDDPREWINPGLNEGAHAALRRTLAGEVRGGWAVELAGQDVGGMAGSG